MATMKVLISVLVVLVASAASERCNDEFLEAIQAAKDGASKCIAASVLATCVENSGLSGTALESALDSARSSTAVVLASENCEFLERTIKTHAQVRTIDGSILISVPNSKDITFDRQQAGVDPVSIFSLVRKKKHTTSTSTPFFFWGWGVLTSLPRSKSYCSQKRAACMHCSPSILHLPVSSELRPPILAYFLSQLFLTFLYFPSLFYLACC